MAGYNRVLNNMPEYKQALIDSLVKGEPFPEHQRISDHVSEEAAYEEHDPLLMLFTQRDFSDIDKIMQLQNDRFGAVDTELFWSVLSYIAAHGNIPKSSPLARLAALAKNHVSHIPDDTTFTAWRQLHEAHFKDAISHFSTLVFKGMHEYEAPELSKVFEDALTWSGLHKHGWQVAHNTNTNLVSIAKKSKKILIGPSRIRLSERRLVGLLLHEIYIHALWAEHHEVERDTSKEEGIGTLMEQLTLSVFYPLRMYRFMAICFAIGADGTPRDMRQTFEILVQIRNVLVTDESQEAARIFVAKEVVRVFRNLPPDIPGLVYIRDKHYLEHNAAIWSTLTEGEPSERRYTALVAPWEKA